MDRSRIGRGVAILAVAALAVAVVSPAFSAAPLTKAKVKKIAKKQATNVFNSLIGPAIAGKQNMCADGAILAYAFINGDGGDGGTGGTPSTSEFSTDGVGPSFNCKGTPIQVQHFPDGFYQVLIPGITTINPTLGVYIFQSADSHNDGIVNIDTHEGDDYIEVDTFEASDGAPDDADFYLIALR